MSRSEKLLKRLQESEAENSFFNELAKASKYLIFVDRHYSGLNAELKDLGYDSEIVPEFIDYPRIDRDFQTHLWLNAKRKNTKEKPIIFITNNYADFREPRFNDKNYTIFSVKGNYFANKLINKVIDHLRTKKLSDGIAYTI